MTNLSLPSKSSATSTSTAITRLRHWQSVRFVRGRDEDGKATVAGKVVTVQGSLEPNSTGKTELVAVCATEQEQEQDRVKTLGEHFGGESGEY
ncbi:uncharacterized protein THITE_2109124 [Thermothielavioides terrestris NRRL 8126]|jgi:hypothetical protein|uniref:Uncharacterized protein n=1 Tax=Thermothielavioides terrestris (strain ATCC 38088 / NRRL 8126) TaxID=578455 RepID=G2QTV6_THETT|nr:uncharacterized protein THITE_2109124 [Thermothielavioides terrestris NRRL 8126]AEO63615.1 hypothetical protein THITE_2109124 [Thermothielavioides terrestris NRRL 8126]